VPEAVVKAQADVQSDTEQLDAAKRLLDSQQKLFEEGALAGRRVDEARVAYVPPRRSSMAPTEHLRALNSVSKGDQIATARAQLQSATAQLAAPRRSSATPKSAVRDRAWWPTGPCMKAKWPAAGTPLLTVMDISKVVARVNIPQNQIASVKVRANGRSRARRWRRHGRGPGHGGEPRHRSRQHHGANLGGVQQPGEKLKPGASVHVKIITELVKNATTVHRPPFCPAKRAAPRCW
jgi:HlyD family secretion protein